MILLVNTCCLIPNNSKWPLSSLFNFVCLTYVYFWVPWVTLWYPKIIVLKSMMSRLSNVVSDTFFGFLSAFLQCYEVWSFFRIFRGKMHILECALKLNKIMNVSNFVRFDPGKLWRWSTRRWKAWMFYSLMIRFWVLLGYHVFL